MNIDRVTEYPPVSAPDYMPVEQLRDLQLRRLQATVTRTWQQVGLFRSRMEERGLEPGISVRSTISKNFPLR